ncbi:MAG: hypothetical protein CMO55_17040 [Verrucomicrobiales bacterium]|nr:hypothetical protein [Verrucomicrobiales bacterium]
MNFSQLLQQNRKKHKLSQQELAERINEHLSLSGKHTLTQASISAWELGRQVPSRTRENIVLAIADVLEIDRNRILDVWIKGKKTPALPDDQYIKNLQRWIKRAISECADKENTSPSIWLISPQELPALAESSKGKFEELWRPNLASGVIYNLLWVVDEDLASGNFKELYDYLSTIDKDLKFKHPNAHLRNYLLNPTGKVPASISEPLLYAFRGFRDKWEEAGDTHNFQVEWIELTESHMNSEGTIERWREILKRIGELEIFLKSRVALYRSPAPSFPSAATVMIAGTMSTWDDENVSHCYRWLTRDGVKKIEGLVNMFEDWCCWKVMKADGE